MLIFYSLLTQFNLHSLIFCCDIAWADEVVLGLYLFWNIGHAACNWMLASLL